MRKRLIIIFLCIAAFIFFLSNAKGCGIFEKIYRIRTVKSRVHAVLRGIQMRPDGSGTVGDQQLALCRWYADTAAMGDMAELSRASNDFDEWRKGANFYINDYNITNVEIEEGYPTEGEEEKKDYVKPWVFIVTGTIDGSTYIMRVPEGNTITWIQSPW